MFNQTARRTELENETRGREYENRESAAAQCPCAWFHPQYKYKRTHIREPQSRACRTHAPSTTGSTLRGEILHTGRTFPWNFVFHNHVTPHSPRLQADGIVSSSNLSEDDEHIPLSSTLTNAILSTGGPTNLCSSS